MKVEELSTLWNFVRGFSAVEKLRDVIISNNSASINEKTDSECRLCLCRKNQVPDND